MARFLRVIGARRYAEVGRLVRGRWGDLMGARRGKCDRMYTFVRKKRRKSI